MFLRSLTVLAALALSFCAAAQTSAPLVFSKALASDEGPLDVAPYKYVDNGHSKSRSPCPFLNSCANHGILPNDGKNIRLEVFARLLKKAGVADKLASTLVDQIKKIAVTNNGKDSTRPVDAIDLADLIPHGLIEHDLSISRWDVVTPAAGDNFADGKLMGKLIAFTSKFATDNGNDGKTITLSSLGAWHNERKRLELEERKHTPASDFRTKFLCAGEAFLLLNVLGRDGQISVKDANTFLFHEKFPEKWTPPQNPGMIKTLAKVAECATAFALPTSWLSWFNEPSMFSKAMSWVHGHTDAPAQI